MYRKTNQKFILIALIYCCSIATNYVLCENYGTNKDSINNNDNLDQDEPDDDFYDSSGEYFFVWISLCCFGRIIKGFTV
jgi:hypothetical protein